MASKLTLWRKAGRFITGVVVLAFFLPFFGVSCQGLDVVTVSGADMVGGCKPGGMIADAEDRASDMGAPKNSISERSGPTLSKVKIEPLAIIALALAFVGFGLAWVRTRGALIGTLVVSLAGIGALAGLYVKVGGEMKDAIMSQLKSKESGSSIGREVAKETDVSSGGRMGLWLAALGMASAGALAAMALREREDSSMAPPGGPPFAAGPGPGPYPGGPGPGPGPYPG